MKILSKTLLFLAFAIITPQANGSQKPKPTKPPKTFFTNGLKTINTYSINKKGEKTNICSHLQTQKQNRSDCNRNEQRQN